MLCSVTCPSCYEEFTVMAPGLAELPCQVDYDCEICCRPMFIRFESEDDDIWAQAIGLDD